MRYEVIADWLKRDMISDSVIFESDFTYEELEFLSNYDLRQVQRDKPELLEYFFEVK